MYEDLIKKYGSPLYLYDEQEIINNINTLKSISSSNNVNFNYAIKANSNRSILQIIKNQNMKVDSTGIGEVFLNKDAGFTNRDIYCVGNNFSREELQQLVNEDIVLSIDSMSQLHLLGEICPGFDKLMVRVNAPFGAGSNEKVVTGGKNTKFGIDYENIDEVKNIIKKYDFNLIGINQHIGSAYLEHESLLKGINTLLDFILKNNINNLKLIDFGGGFGLNYKRRHNDEKMDFDVVKKELRIILNDFLSSYDNKDVQFEFEPGRYIVASAGTLIGKVTSIKNRNNKLYIGSDLGFTNLIRPVLYDAYHEVEILTDNKETVIGDVVGNICESGDFMCTNRELKKPNIDDLILVHDVGAYGYCLSSNYNARTRPIEILKTIDGEFKIIRRRETLEDLLRLY